MARRGRFGRLPRSAPSLTSTIIAIAREMQARRDSNLMDAWQNGGTFEGRPVTDEIVLAHWRGRMAALSPSDPEYDTMKNTVMQYEYAIGESKAATDYAQGKLTDTQMAQFYLGWAAKVPKDSEFYRVLQRDAAQFLRAAKQRGAAEASQRKDAAYEAGKAKIAADFEAPGAYLTSVIENMIRTRFPVGETADSVDKVFHAADPSAALEMVSRINDVNYTGSPDERTAADGTLVSSAILYHDPITGLPVTAADVQARLAQLDPNYSGAVTVDYYTSALRNQIEGQTRRYNLAVDNGKKEEANKALSQRADTSAIGREAGAWPIEQSYIDLRDGFLKVWLDKATSPDAKVQAFEQYQQALIGLANDERRPPNDSLRTSLLAEATGDASVDSVAESLIGTSASEHTTLEGSGTAKGDIADTWADLTQFVDWQEAVAKGEAHWAMEGGEIVATSVQPSPTAIRVFVPQGNGLPPLAVMVEGRPITAAAVDANGFRINPVNPNSSTVGMVYDMADGSRLYSYDNNGRTMYSNEPTWGDDVAVTEDAGGIQLTRIMGGVDLSTPEGVLAAADSGVFTVRERGVDQLPEVSIDPGAVVRDPERDAAGPDPNTDALSPTVALLMGRPDGPEQLTFLARDPNFRLETEIEARWAAGQQYDPINNVFVGGDLAAGDANVQAVRLQVAQAVPVFDEARRIGLWDRTTTKPTFRQAAGGLSPDERSLPSDRARQGGLSFPLTGAFVPGTTLLTKGLSKDAPPANLTIQTKGSLTLPNIPDLVVTPRPVGPAPVPDVYVPPAPIANASGSPDDRDTQHSVTTRYPLRRPSGTGALVY